MNIRILLLTPLISINITACSSIGNVVPKTGPSMEQVYDGMSRPTFSLPNNIQFNTSDQTQKIATTNQENITTKKLTADPMTQDFKEIPNPQLSVYIYPHFAGTDQIPIPGYTTVFNVYEKDLYELRTE